MKTEYPNRRFTGGGKHFVTISMTHKTRQALEALTKKDQPISRLIEIWIQQKIKELK